MSEEPKKRRGAWIWWALAAVLLMAYPLSTGPAIRIADAADDHVASLRTFNVVYAPIGWLRRHSKPARTVIDWYMVFWRGE
jgi:hypothetical protein